MSMADDHMLLAQIAAGDPEALRLLYARYHVRLRGYLWSLLSERADLVEDALQDVFVAIWRSAASFAGRSQPSTWIYHLTRRVASKVRRQHIHYHHVPIDDDGEGEHAVWHHASHEEAVVARLTLDDALSRLSSKHYEVLELTFVHGFLVEEIAQILDIPAGTVKSRLSYARRALAVALAQAGNLEESYTDVDV